MRITSVVVLLAGLSRPAVAQSVSMPERPSQVCHAACLGYSVSTRIWMCASTSSASGMVSDPGKSCRLQLVRDGETLADAVIYSDGRNAPPASSGNSAVEKLIALMPNDLAPITQTLELPDGAEVAIPATQHRIRVTRESPQSGSRVAVLCDRGPAIPTREVVVLRSEPQCGLRERYQLQLGPDAAQVALIQDRSEGCVDYRLGLRRAQAVDLDRVCSEKAPRSARGKR